MKRKFNHFNFFLRLPSQKRKKIKIIKRSYGHVTNPSGCSNVTLINSDLDLINKQLRSEKISLNEAIKASRLLIEKLRKESGLTEHKINDVNQNILDRFLSEYKRDRPNLVDFQAARNKFLRNVNLLDNLSLVSASKEELYSKLESANLPDNRRRECIHKLNTVFKWLGRDLRLVAPYEEIREVNYINEDELVILLNSIDDSGLKLAIEISFYSGLRVGELKALNKSSIKNNCINVDAQIDTALKKRLPKNRKKRRAILPDNQIELVRKWSDLEKKKYTRFYLNKNLQKHTRSVLKKHIKWHDLRHSFAIHLLSRGAPITLVAQSLGNSVLVCEKHYSGHIISDQGVSTLLKYFSSPN